MRRYQFGKATQRRCIRVFQCSGKTAHFFVFRQRTLHQFMFAGPREKDKHTGFLNAKVGIEFDGKGIGDAPCQYPDFTRITGSHGLFGIPRQFQRTVVIAGEAQKC